MSVKRLSYLLLLWLFLVSPGVLSGQSTYNVEWRKEMVYLGIGGVTSGVGLYFLDKNPLFTTDELTTLDRNDINRLDRIATHNNSSNADLASDVFWYGSMALPLLFLAGEESKADFGPIMALFGEVSFINLGITVLFKNTFNRPRPFVFNDSFDEQLKLKRSAKTAFVSGHTSITAANCFFAAKVFSDYYPDSKWKPLVWISAATIPAVTGYLRVAAGKHYPTDVLAGYALGATIGYIVPQLHKSRFVKEKKLSIFGGVNSLLVLYQF